ncbi:DUF896 domain-containing protein [Propionispora hippei]|uniref:UPF0291 protein SAMN02745170_02722 n=1 Tax=Propionispora hippei DSM 15287 TaxID=1123003 RepID=A0A1M6JXW9_9FIRM|nr:DUF896 domain-containing protein [Propionispora hippei]SHJ51557.1 Uncharacterized protein YnzC, UPF0291/DUF896 family [Propionispora hippei DSM 15287]
MITPEVIARINELAQKQKSGVLNDSEKTEQAQLRRLYIDNIKKQVKAQLDSVTVVPHSETCGCGCHTKH